MGRRRPHAMNTVPALPGLLPICAACKKIRNDQGRWDRVEIYVEDRFGVRFTHGICPECFGELYR